MSVYIATLLVVFCSTRRSCFHFYDCCYCSRLSSRALLRRGSSFGFVYPDPANATETRTSLYVGLIQSYDPTKLDDQLDSVGTVVGAELAVQHINANDTILQGYTLHYNFINSQVCFRLSVQVNFVVYFSQTINIIIIANTYIQCW